MNTNIPDELLTAYVDGELEGTERARVEQAIAHDARLAQRVAQQRALRGRLRKAFDGALREPLPQRLVNAAKLEGRSGPAQIIDLARVRAERARRPERRRIPIPSRTAVATTASLIVGLGAGLLIEHLIAGASLTEYRDGTLLASGSLNHALNEQLASATPGSGAVRIGLSFRAKSGGYCRTFMLGSNRDLAGLACKEQQRWRILTLLGADTPNAPRSAQAYRMAGSAMPAPLLQAVNEHISGEPLDAAAEAKARRSGWH
jgi:Putative zinc-finger